MDSYRDCSSCPSCNEDSAYYASWGLYPFDRSRVLRNPKLEGLRRALEREIHQPSVEASDGLGFPWKLRDTCPRGSRKTPRIRVLQRALRKVYLADRKKLHFILKEQHSFNQTFRGASYGGSRLIDITKKSKLYWGETLFTVYKSRDPVTIQVSIHSPELLDILLPYGLQHRYGKSDIVPVLKHCSKIQELLLEINEKKRDLDSVMLAIKLEFFFNEFLLDPAIFSGLAYESFSLDSSIQFKIWQLRQQRKALIDLNEIELMIRSQWGIEPDVMLPVDPSKPVDQDEERRKSQTQMILGVRKRFGEKYTHLKEQNSRDVYSGPSQTLALRELSKFSTPINMQDAWKKAIQSIRQLLKDHLPDSVEGILYTIMAADAMRNTDHRTISESEVFRQDLGHWRNVVHEPDKRIYDYMVFKLWGETPGTIPTISSSLDSTKLYFQKLFQNLLSNTGVEHFSLEGLYGERLSVIQSRYAEGKPPSSGSDVDNKPGLRILSNASDHRSKVEKGKAESPDPQVLMLAATVIFSAVIAIFLILYYPIEHARANSIIQGKQFLGSDPLSALKRNCILLACYLGLSTIEIEESPRRNNPADQIPCKICGKSNRVANIARHMRTHNKIHVHKCATCGYGTDRSDNYKTHIRKHCRARFGTTMTIEQGVATPSTENDPLSPYVGQQFALPGTAQDFSPISIRQDLFPTNMEQGYPYPTIGQSHFPPNINQDFYPPGQEIFGPTGQEFSTPHFGQDLPISHWQDMSLPITYQDPILFQPEQFPTLSSVYPEALPYELPTGQMPHLFSGDNGYTY